jgi:hypothetical protein
LRWSSAHGVDGGHHGRLFRRDLRVFFVGQEMHPAIGRLKLQIVCAAAAGESTQRLAARERHIDNGISRGDARTGIGERLLQFRQRHLACDAR